MNIFMNVNEMLKIFDEIFMNGIQAGVNFHEDFDSLIIHDIIEAGCHQ